MKYFKSHSEFLNEAKLSAIHKAAKKGSYPVTVVVVSNGSVTKQEIVNTPAAVPAVFNQLQKEYPGATINIESKTGETLFVESVLNEKLARGLKPLLKLGTTITKKAGEDALLDLSDKFDRIDDEYAGTIASHLDMAIELMQDGYSGDATKKLKQFNKACKDVLKGKEIGSAFESVVTEAKGFKSTKDFEDFLEEIDGMGESQIKKIMGKDYIDTPGFYQDEKDNYEDVIDFMTSNMGTSEFEKLESWWESNVAESVVNEALSKEQKMVETFLNKIAKEFDYSIQDAVRFVKETISKMRLDESIVTEGSSKEFEEALAHYAEIGGHSDNGRRELVDAYWKLLNKKQQDEYFMALAHAQYAKNNKVGWAKEVTEKTYNKKSLMKAMKADDGMIQLGNGQEYVIYAYGNGNDDNDDMWGDKTIFALDQDGEEHEVEYSDIVSYNENKLTWHGLKESLGIETINEKDDAGTHLDNLADLVGKAKDFFAIGKELKSGKYKYDYSDSMMPMYTIKADGFKFAILNKRYVDGGDREVGEIAIGLMESVNASFMNERRSGQNSDDALILIQQALQGMKNMKAEIKGDTVIIHNKAKDEFTYSLNDGGDVQEFIDELEESVINEGRSINKISKEFGETVVNMKKTVDEWKTAEGDRKAELLEKLRELNKMKANLEKELDEAVSGKDKNVTLALGEE